MSLIIQHVSNALDSTPSITGQIGLTKFKQDIRKIDHHTALGLTCLKIASLEFFKQLAVTRYFLALVINLLLVRCKFSIAFLKLIPNDCAGDATQRPADGCPGPRTPNRGTNNRTCGGTKTRPTQRPLLSG